MYDRAALILDTENHPLGGLSLDLIALGLRPLYATELDELILLSREYRSAVSAILLPSGDVTRRLPSLRKHVLEPLGLALSAVVPVGHCPTPEQAQPLRDEGIRFRLPAEPEPHELRYVVARAISLNDPGELRMDPRVPCQLPVSVQAEHRTVEAVLTDISRGGAFVSVAHPFGVDSEVLLRFPLVGAEGALRAHVRWQAGAAAPAWRDRGMGVEFLEVDAATDAALRRFISEKKRRFRL